MRTWLSAGSDVPVLGFFCGFGETAVLLSWLGALYDLTIPLWLSLSRTRALAFSTVVVFHVLTWMLFPIGVFPWLMILSATLFFEPTWPGDLAARLRGDSVERVGVVAPPLRPASWLPLTFVVCWCLVQLLVPLRFLTHPGPVNWTEHGFRFSWRVMLVEKTGFVEFRIVDPDLKIYVHVQCFESFL